jgi:predicted negative regulator of RcsB-dependent stress response
MQLSKYCKFALVIAVAASCAPQRPYRAPIPSTSAPASSARVAPSPPAPVAPPAPPIETVRKPVPQEGKIREQDIRAKSPTPAPASKDVKEAGKQASVSEPRSASEATSAPTAPPLADDSSLLAKITPGVSPQRAASLRVTDEGRKLLDAGEPAKAMSRLERTIVIDSTNGYGYFYLAKAQYRLGHYQESLNLIEVAQSRLSGETFWLAEVHALRGENYRALGQAPRAEASYHQSLRLNSGNRTASDGLARMTAETPAAAK